MYYDSLSHALDAKMYGGKASALARAMAVGLPVPDGLALPYETVSRAAFGKDHEFRAWLGDRLLERLSGHVALSFAVRSSAVGEDGRSASFAGVHRTCLNVPHTLRHLAMAIGRVEESGRTASAFAYRKLHGVGHLPPRMGIVIQHFVPASLAGVLFTRNHFVVEVARGLGDAVVQGLVTPEHYRIRPDGSVLQVREGNQTIAVRPSAAERGDVEEFEVEPSTKRLLDDAQLVQLAKLACDCQRTFGPALDIEWAICDNVLHLLQVRPITDRQGAT